MKYVRSCVVLLAALLILAGCTENNSVTVGGFPVSGELLTSEQHNLSYVPMNSNRYIYVSGDVVLISEWNGDYHWSVYSLSDLKDGFPAGRKGRGPNEFIYNPHMLVPTPGDGSFVAYDGGAGNFRKFVLENGQLVIQDKKEMKLPRNVMGNMLTRINDSAYLCFNDTENSEFMLINPDTGKYREVVKYPRFMAAQAEASGAPVFWVSITNGPVAKPDGTRFAVFYFHYKYFRIFDANGNVLKEVSVDIAPYSSHNPTSESDPFTFAYDSAFASDKYIYVICRNDDRKGSSDKRSELQVWSWDGEPVASYQLDRMVVFGYMTMHDMKLYSFDYLDEDYNEACINVFDLSRLPR